MSPKTKRQLYDAAQNENAWFTKRNIERAFEGLKVLLEKEQFQRWIAQYELDDISSKQVGIIMAGNIPMVGIHDLICILISGHAAEIKLSRQDSILITYIIDQLIEIEPNWSDYIITTQKLNNPDAVIATGSDNTSRYFEYYFAHLPNIIRKNRTSIAVLDGKEDKEDIALLGDDVFSYFGFGCRNVSKLFLPQAYDPAEIFECWKEFSSLMDHHKYYNNYLYQKSIKLIDMEAHLDSGYCLLEENEKMVSPISVLYYSKYDNISNLKDHIDANSEKIQCVVTNLKSISGAIPFGMAQSPSIGDYADRIDTMEFLSNL